MEGHGGSGSPNVSAARRLLRLREGDIERGIPITPRVGRLRFEEAAKDLLNDCRVNGRRSLVVAERRIKKHLVPFFCGRRMAVITTADVRSFIAKRQADTIRVRKARDIRTKAGWVTVPEERKTVSNGEINRELTLLKRTFNLAIQAGKLIHKPHIPMLVENNVRTGFFEPDQCEAVARHLPPALSPVVAFAYITGWRIPSEALTLQSPNVDFAAGEVASRPRNHEELGGPGLSDDSRATSAARSTVGGHEGPEARAREDLPVGLPSRRKADQKPQKGVAGSVHQSRLPRTHPSRSQAHSGPQHGSGWHS